LNEYSRQDNSLQQSNQSSLRSNRGENTTPLRSRDRENEQNVSRRSGDKPGPMATTSTSPIPQRSTRTNEDTTQPPRRNRSVDRSSSTGKQEERQTGGNTGIQEQSPWNQGDGKSS